MVMNSLKVYSEILESKRKAKYLGADIEQKIRQTQEIMKSCHLCERRCGVNRMKNEVGECCVPNKCLISSEFLHFGEEPFFVPSHTIFFMGCNFHCQFCQNWTISQWRESGSEIAPEELARIIERRHASGSINVNFVGGEPTPHLLQILYVLRQMQKREVNIPVIWNSNFYMSTGTMDILKGIIDVYLADFKYGNDRCALRLSKIPNYFGVITRNIESAVRCGEVVIRHLVLPGHIECCSYPVLDWISKNPGRKVIVNIMDQYTPHYKAYKYKDINRRLTESEFSRVVVKARELDLDFIT